jgi:anti-anti-sigma factor
MPFHLEVATLTLQIANREVDGMAVLELGGRIVLGEESSALREKVNGLLVGGNKRIILNVDRVGYIDSAGLGILVGTYHVAKSHGASLALCNLGSHFKGVLQVTKLLTVFDTYKTEADAVRSFAT